VSVAKPESPAPSPKISIGLPVFNGEMFLDEAIASLVGQSLDDLEIIISDNASTDRTGEICRKWVQLDDRIRYLRHDENRGAAWNFNYVFAQATGKYFHWAAHDDWLMTEFLEACAEILDQHDDVALSYTRVRQVDERGEFLQFWSEYSDITSDDEVKRLNGALRDWMCLPVFGLIRSDMLRETSLIRPFHASDRLLLAELAVRGKFYLSDEYLFIHREHPTMSGNAYVSAYERGVWWDPQQGRAQAWPNWVYHLNVARMIVRSPLSVWGKVRGLGLLFPLMLRARKQLSYDIYKMVSDTLGRLKARQPSEFSEPET